MLVKSVETRDVVQPHSKAAIVFIFKMMQTTLLRSQSQVATADLYMLFLTNVGRLCLLVGAKDAAYKQHNPSVTDIQTAHGIYNFLRIRNCF